MKLKCILGKILENWRNRGGKVNSGNNSASGNKNKTSSWLEVDFLKSPDFVKESMEHRLKSDVLDLAEEMGMSLSDFYDLVFRSDRNGCTHSLGEEWTCWDSTGEDVAYGLDAIEEAFECKDPSCSKVCELGCCAKQNKLAFNMYRELIKMKETKENGSNS